MQSWACRQHIVLSMRDVCRLELPYLGKLLKLLIGHDGHGDASSWKLDMVEVEEEDSGRITCFVANR